MAFDIDVRQIVPTIRVPTLIIHEVGDRVCHVENARWLAANLPGAKYVELPGSDHVPWFYPDATLAEIREFLTGAREPEEPEQSREHRQHGQNPPRPRPSTPFEIVDRGAQDDGEEYGQQERQNHAADPVEEISPDEQREDQPDDRVRRSSRGYGSIHSDSFGCPYGRSLLVYGGSGKD